MEEEADIIAKYKKKAKKLKRRNRALEEQFAAQQDMLSMTTEHMHSIQDKLRDSQKELNRAYKQITDSVASAERIQRAMLESIEKVRETFSESFILYYPKHVLSGDFYWLHRSYEHVFMAAIDCTGHGVPGAMLTVLANSLLNQIVVAYQIHDPEAILQQLDALMAHYTHKEGRSQQINDGLDISLIRYTPSTGEVRFAGAHQQIYHLRGENLSIYKPNRYSIGSNRGRLALNGKFHVQSGDMVYLHTDGFTDQFGGELDRKFSSERLKNLLKSVSLQPISQQQQAVENAFLQWKGNRSQTDDMLIIGIRF